MLSDNDIKEAIKNNNIIVEPFSENQLNPAALSIHLGFEFLKPKSGNIIDPLNDIKEDIYQKISLSENDTYVLKPDEFILGETFEKIGISKNMGFLLDGTSTMARLGVSIVQTAMVVDTGVGATRAKKITLEIKNNGNNSVVLRPRMKIGRAVIFKLNTTSSYGYDERRKYKDQTGVGVPIKTERV